MAVNLSTITKKFNEVKNNQVTKQAVGQPRQAVQQPTTNLSTPSTWGSNISLPATKGDTGFGIANPYNTGNKGLTNYTTSGNAGSSNATAPVSTGGGITDYQMSEIIRKAQAGIPLDKPTQEKMAIYNMYTKDATSPQVPQTPAFDAEAYMKQFQDQINNMYNQQREAQLAQLIAQRDEAIGEINQQKAQVAPQYQSMRNQTDAMNMQNVQRLREVMASSGLTSSGENVTAQVAQNNARLSSINSLNLQEQQTIDDFNRRITDLQNPANENVLIAQLEAERARALLDIGMRADEIGYNRSRDSIMDQRYMDEIAYGRGRDAEADRRYYDERSYERGWNEKQWDYQTGRDKVADDRYNQEWEYKKEQDKIEKAWREHVYNNMSASEKAQLEWAKQQYGEDAAWKMFALKYQGELDKSLAQTQLGAYSGFNNAKGGGGYSNNYKTQQQSSKSSTFPTFQGHMQQAVQMGVPQSWVPALTELVGRESSWNPSAKNPKSTAHGYGQFLKSTRSNYEKKTGLNYSNPVHQLVMMAQYVKDRYGTPEKALAFWDKNKYY